MKRTFIPTHSIAISSAIAKFCLLAVVLTCLYYTGIAVQHHSANKNDNDYLLKTNPALKSYSASNNTSIQKKYFVDGAVTDKNSLEVSVDKLLSNKENSHTFELFSHGRPGELFINGQWLKPEAITSFIRQQLADQHDTINHVNIYGCEFAKGEKGLEAIAYLEKSLGIHVSASTNITGLHGDWKLEAGGGPSLSIKNYPHDLQIVVFKQSFESNQNGIQGFYANFIPDNSNGSVGAQGIGPPAYGDNVGAAEGSRYWFTTTVSAACGNNCSGLVFSVNIPVQANHPYQVKLFYRKQVNGFSGNFANLTIGVNGSQLGNVTTSNTNWTQFVSAWNSGGTTNANLTIFDNQSTALGNDFVLDDIELVDVCGTVAAPLVGAITQPDCTHSTGSVSLSGLPAGSWTLTRSPGGSTSGSGTNTTVTGLSSGNYTFTVTNSSGCTSSSSGLVTITTQPTAPATPTVNTTAGNCAVAGTATITNFNAALNYLFNPGGPSVASNGTIANLTPGTNYTLTASNGNCVSGASSTFSISTQGATPATPIVTTTAGSCTAIGSATITNFNATLAYAFNPAGPSVISAGGISGLTPGTNYTVTAGNGTCVSGSSNTFSITAQGAIPASPIVSTTPGSCTATGTATITNFNATLGYVFSPAGPSVSTGGGINGLTPGINYTVTAGNGTCASGSSNTFSITAQGTTPSIPVINITTNNCSAVGPVTVTNFNAANTYVFNPAGPAISATGAITGMVPCKSYSLTASLGSCSSSPSSAFSIIAVAPALQ